MYACCVLFLQREKLRLYRTILSCLVLVLRCVGHGLWSQRVSEGQEEGAGYSSGRGGGDEEDGFDGEVCVEAWWLVDQATNIMNSVQDEATQQVSRVGLGWGGLAGEVKVACGGLARGVQVACGGLAGGCR